MRDLSTDFIAFCPKTPEGNLRWRLGWRAAAATDPGLQRDFRQMAFADPLFFFNAFGFCFEPRSVVKVRPFVTWPHQDPAILAMDDAIARSEQTESPVDLVCDKSRGQGATWMYLLVFLRRWLRDPMFSAGLVTRNEGLVDSPRDPDTLMWKIVWAIDMLPFWMRPKGLDYSKHRNLKEHSLVNPENGASIVGYAATGDVARGGRKTVFAMDELAAFKPGDDYAALNSTQHVTHCRFLVSTYRGDSGAYYEAATKDSSAVKVVLDWRDNPTQNRDLYEYRDGHVVPEKKAFSVELLARLAAQHEKLRRRGYVLEGKIRNAWYNSQCLRPGATPRGIAEELDRDPHGSVSKVFAAAALEYVRHRSVMPPIRQGRLVYDREKAVVLAPWVNESAEGEFRVWCTIALDGRPPLGSYSVGADVSAGGAGDYTSNSVACVTNRVTGEQVAEWVSNAVIPTRFAHVLAALGHWFYDALLIPEANFGAGLVKVLVDDLAYPNLYYRDVEVEGLHKKTNKPGFWMTNDDTKMKLFERMQEAMAEDAFVVRSEALVAECREYEWKNGRVVHAGAQRSLDEAAKGKAHGDRVIAAALSWFGVSDAAVVSDDAVAETVEAPPGSMAARLRAWDKEHGIRKDPWDGGEIDDDDRLVLRSRNDPWG